MTWNELLYQYALEHGGEYFVNDLNGSYWNAALLLPGENGPLMVRTVAHSAGRGGLFYSVQALLRCTLDRDYCLKISIQNAVLGGVNTVRKGLDKFTERFGVDLHDDYGCPEVTARRHVKTDDPEFTRMVLRDLTFRQMLTDWPDYEVTVRKNAPMDRDDRSHIIAVSASPEAEHWGGYHIGVYEPEETRTCAAEKFVQSLDALIALAEATQTALTAWKMPPKQQRKI